MTSDLKALPFFKSNRTPAFYWMLGLFYGDGWLSRENTIGFCGSIEVIEKLENLIGGLRRQKKDMYDFEILVINSKELSDWFLSNTDLVGGKKSHTITFPRKLLADSPENTWHFLRGFFDADGYVSAFKENMSEKKTRGIPVLKAGIATASEKFIQDMQDFFERELGFTAIQSSSIKIMNDKEFRCHGVSFLSIKARTFLDKLYANKTDNFYSRKYYRYVNLKNFQDSLYASKCKACLEKPLWHFRKGLCINCFYMERKRFCICGEGAFSFGVCQAQYHRYRRTKVSNLLGDFKPDCSLMIKEKNFNDIDKSLKNKLPSFYAAKHEGFKSFAEYWDNKNISDIRLEKEAARKDSNGRVKPASWFKSQHAFKIVDLLKERFPDLRKCVDPFAGWGARAAGVLAHELEYVGLDMNPSLVHELKSFYAEEENAIFLEENSYEMDFSKQDQIEDADFVLTCPPYWRAEDYGYKGYSARKYSGFLRDLFKLIVNMAALPDMKVMAFCLENFSYDHKKYNFVRDFEFFLEKHGFSYEKIIYAQKQRSFNDDLLDQNVFIIECNKAMLAQSFEENTFRVTDAVCSFEGCRNKHEAKNMCKKHYFQTYHLKKMGGVLKRQPIAPDASKVCKIEGCEKEVHAHGVCNSHYYHLKSRVKKRKEKVNTKKIYPCTFPGCEAQYQHRETLCKIHWLAKHGKEPGKITGRPGKEMVPCKECGKPDSATQPSLLCSTCYGRWYRSQNPDKRLKKNQTENPD